MAVEVSDFKPRKRDRGMLWRVIETIKFSGYWMVKTIPPHPRALSAQGRRPGGYVYLHIVLMENLLHRCLQKFEDVHHINFIKLDNRLKNLEILNKIDHRIIHKRRCEEYRKKYERDISKVSVQKMVIKGRTKVELECVVCHNVFTIDKLLYNYKVRNRIKYNPLCSRKCSFYYKWHKNDKYENKGILREYREKA